MNSNRTGLEQDVIDYVKDVQEIHEKALAFYKTLMEIRYCLDALETSKTSADSTMDFGSIPRTPAQMATSGSEFSAPTRQFKGKKNSAKYDSSFNHS